MESNIIIICKLDENRKTAEPKTARINYSVNSFKLEDRKLGKWTTNVNGKRR